MVREIAPKATYRIATLDYLAQGNDKMEAFKSATNVVSPQASSNNTRFLIMNYFKEQTAQGKVVNSHKEGRTEWNNLLTIHMYEKKYIIDKFLLSCSLSIWTNKAVNNSAYE